MTTNHSMMMSRMMMLSKRKRTMTKRTTTMASWNRDSGSRLADSQNKEVSQNNEVFYGT